MRRRPLLNLVLLLAVAALLTLLIVDNPTAPAPEPITTLSGSAITKVKIAYPDAPSVMLERIDGAWRLLQPVRAPANEATVDQVLRLAEAESLRELSPGKAEAAALGLKPPAYAVTFNDQVTVELGATNPLEGQRYARVGGAIHLIDDPNTRALNADYHNLVALKLLPEYAVITKLELPGATLTPTPEGGWAVAPTAADRGADAAQETIDTWLHTRALWTEAAKNEDGEEAPAPAGKVVVHTADGPEYTFVVVAREPQLILRRPDLGVNFHVAANRAKPLLDMRHPALAPKLKNDSAIELDGTAAGKNATAED